MPDPLQVELFALSCACPAKGTHEIHECPLDAVFRRHLSTQERWKWCQSLSHDQAMEMLATYQGCPRCAKWQSPALASATRLAGS